MKGDFAALDPHLHRRLAHSEMSRKLAKRNLLHKPANKQIPSLDREQRKSAIEKLDKLLPVQLHLKISQVIRNQAHSRRRESLKIRPGLEELLPLTTPEKPQPHMAKDRVPPKPRSLSIR